MKAIFWPIFFGTFLFFGLWAIEDYSFLLFHSLAELFSIVVACGLFMFAWNSRQFTQNAYILFIGIAYLFIGGIDLVHTLAYEGMGVFEGSDTNLSAQLWIGSRYIEAVSLFVAPFLIGRTIRHQFVFAAYIAASSALLASIFYWDIFPICFVEGTGLTTFKKVSEYVISSLLLASILVLFSKRKEFAPHVLRLLIAAAAVTIASEWVSTQYLNIHCLPNVLGHYLKIVSFYLVYRAIVVTGLTDPFTLLFRDLEQNKIALKHTNENLEKIVGERTNSLRASEARYRAVVEDQTELICRSYPDTTIIFVNQAYCRYFGATYDDLVGQKFLPFIPEEDREKVRDHIASLSRDNPVVTHEHRVIGENGEVRWMSWSNRAIFDESGKLIEFQGTGRDVTDRKLADIALKEQIQHFRLFSMSTGDSFWNWDMVNGTVERSSGFYRAFGYSEQEIQPVSEWWVDRLHPEDKERVLNTFDAAVAGTDTSCGYDYRFRCRDNTYADIEDHLCLIRDATGEVVRSLGAMRDVTEQKIAKREISKSLAEKEEYYARAIGIINHSVDSIITIDESGVIESVNPSTESLFGYEKSEIVGQNVRIIMPEPYRSNHDGYIKRYLSTGVKNILDSSRELKGLHKDGTLIPLRLGVYEVKFGEKRIFAGIIHDLTHEFELKQRLLQAQKMESLGTLAGGIAHDFNNIIQAISGFCKIARKIEDGSDEVLSMCLKEVESGANRAADLVSQIATFSRKGEVSLGLLDLAPPIEEALKFIRSSLPTTIRIESKIDPECVPVIANATQIHQVVTNLCTNAMHAMENHSGLLSVSLDPLTLDSSLETLSGRLEAGEYIQLTVTDTGVGIDPLLLPSVIDPFFTTKVVGKGTGLGLAVVHGIATGMNGGLIIQSELGKGTTVRMMLPVDRLNADDVQLHEEPQSAIDGSGHILVVDDEEAITIFIKIALESYGYTVETYNDSISALDAVKNSSKKYTMAILDYTMPKKTGLELAVDFEALIPETPVILVTGLKHWSEFEKTKSKNIVDIIRKPFDVENLVTIINRSRY